MDVRNKFPLSFIFGREPEWVPRARQIFADDLRYRYTDHPDIERDPENPSQYLRQTPIGGRVARRLGIKPRNFAQVAEEHFSVLEMTGEFRLPRREHYIDRPNPLFEKGRERLYSAVATVEGIDLHEMQDQDQKKMLCCGIVRALDAYYRWTQGEGVEIALSDLALPRQYRLGRQAGDETNHLYLLDITPHFLSTAPEDQGWWGQEAWSFDRMVEYSGAIVKDNPLRR